MSEKMPIVSLGELANFTMGQSPDSAHVNSDEHGLPFLQGCAEFGAHYPSARVYCFPPLRVARSGSTLISVRAPVGTMNRADQDYCIGRGLAAILAKDGVADDVFLLNAIEQNISYLHRRSQGSTFLAIGSADLDSMPVAAPELPVQQRIAEILSTVDEAIEQTEALIAKTQQIKAGLMHDLFTRGVLPNGKLRPPREEAPHLYQKWKPHYVPSTWTREQLGDVTLESSPICYGIVQPGEHTPNGIPVVAIYNLNADFTATHRSSPEIESAYVRSRVRAGDVLLSIKGSIGRVDVVPVGFVGNISRDVARIRPRADVHPTYLRYALESPRLQLTLTRISVGTTRAELSIGRLKQVFLYLPPEPEQEVIADRLSAVDERIRAELGVLTKLREEKLGLMHDLLTGLVPVAIDTALEIEEGAANV